MKPYTLPQVFHSFYSTTNYLQYKMNENRLLVLSNFILYLHVIKISTIREVQLTEYIKHLTF